MISQRKNFASSSGNSFDHLSATNTSLPWDRKEKSDEMDVTMRKYESAKGETCILIRTSDAKLNIWNKEEKRKVEEMKSTISSESVSPSLVTEWMERSFFLWLGAFFILRHIHSPVYYFLLYPGNPSSASHTIRACVFQEVLIFRKILFPSGTN